MAIQGKAARSSSGAAMSQYDVEVEKRLNLLETENAWLKSKLEEHVATGRTAPPSTKAEEKLEILIEILKQSASLNIDKLSKGRL